MIKETKTHALLLEKVFCGGIRWSVELVEKETGLVQALHCNTKKSAKELFDIGVEEIIEFYEKLKLRKDKVYKENVNFSYLKEAV